MAFEAKETSKVFRKVPASVARCSEANPSGPDPKVKKGGVIKGREASRPIAWTAPLRRRVRPIHPRAKDGPDGLALSTDALPDHLAPINPFATTSKALATFLEIQGLVGPDR